MPPPRRKPLLLFSALLLTTPLTLAQFKNDFSLYPAGTQDCLDDAASASQCTGNDAQTMNQCLCSNGGNFLNNAASCIGREVPSALRTVWNTMNTACSDSKTPLVISVNAFMQIGEQEQVTISTGTPSPTETPPETAPTAPATTGAATQTPVQSAQPSDSDAGNHPEQNPDDPPASISVAALAGIGIAGVIGGAFVAGCVFLLWRRRRGKAPKAPFYPLNEDGRGPNGTTPGTTPTRPEWKPEDQQPEWPSNASRTTLGVAAVSPMTATPNTAHPSYPSSWAGHSPNPGWAGQQQQQQTNWAQYQSPTWASSPVLSQGQQPGAVAELPPDNQMAHELDSIEMPRPPAEMPGSYGRPASPPPYGAPGETYNSHAPTGDRKRAFSFEA